MKPRIHIELSRPPCFFKVLRRTQVIRVSFALRVLLSLVVLLAAAVRLPAAEPALRWASLGRGRRLSEQPRALDLHKDSRGFVVVSARRRPQSDSTGDVPRLPARGEQEGALSPSAPSCASSRTSQRRCGYRWAPAGRRRRPRPLRARARSVPPISPSPARPMEPSGASIEAMRRGRRPERSCWLNRRWAWTRLRRTPRRLSAASCVLPRIARGERSRRIASARIAVRSQRAPVGRLEEFGLHRFDPARVRRFVRVALAGAAGEALARAAGWRASEDPIGQLWVGTLRDGLVSSQRGGRPADALPTLPRRAILTPTATPGAFRPMAGDAGRHRHRGPRRNGGLGLRPGHRSRFTRHGPVSERSDDPRLHRHQRALSSTIRDPLDRHASAAHRTTSRRRLQHASGTSVRVPASSADPTIIDTPPGSRRQPLGRHGRRRPQGAPRSPDRPVHRLPSRPATIAGGIRIRTTVCWACTRAPRPATSGSPRTKVAQSPAPGRAELRALPARLCAIPAPCVRQRLGGRGRTGGELLVGTGRASRCSIRARAAAGGFPSATLSSSTASCGSSSAIRWATSGWRERSQRRLAADRHAQRRGHGLSPRRQERGHPRPGVVYAMHVDTAGRIWAGTEGGLCLLDSTANQWRCYSAADGLPHDSVTGILEDGAGGLWLGTHRGTSPSSSPR